ncbi:carbohydrate-binding module family 14 protein [Streptomyces sp. NPDC051546]|uniref:carbohydrate-binding module family 14 protein n=1 Tax=Streptomyces sp. NPDC051546 TaxID=3365655 RepID=UPI0037894A0F
MMYHRLGLGLGSLVVAVAVAGLAGPAQAAPQDPPPQGHCDTNRLLPDGSDATKFIQCDTGNQPVVKTCPEGTAFNAPQELCDWPQDAQSATRVTAGTARLSVLPLGVTGLKATVAFETGGGFLGLQNAKVTFTSAAGSVLCTAVTDGAGHASCDATGLLATVDQLLRGYTATYTGTTLDGTPILTGSTGKGTITLL